MFWLLQYKRDGNGDNTVRIVVYQNKGEIESQLYCTYDFTPQMFGAAGSRWFDFNGMQASDAWLYVTSNQYEFDPGPTASTTDDSNSLEGGLVWRLELADFSASCGRVTTQYYFNADYYGVPLAASGSTMYWGVHSGGSKQCLGDRPGDRRLHEHHALDSQHQHLPHEQQGGSDLHRSGWHESLWPPQQPAQDRLGEQWAVGVHVDGGSGSGERVGLSSLAGRDLPDLRHEPAQRAAYLEPELRLGDADGG